MRDPYSFQASSFPFPALSILPFSSSSASILPCCCRSFHLPIKYCAIWEKLWCLVTAVTFRKMQIVMNRNHKRNRSGFILWKLKWKLVSFQIQRQAGSLGPWAGWAPDQAIQEHEGSVIFTHSFVHSTNIYPAPTTCQALLCINKTNTNLPLQSVHPVGGDRK